MVDAALRAQNLDIMIRDRFMPEPPTGWVSRELYQPTHLAHEDIGPELLPSEEPSPRYKHPKSRNIRQRATCLPQLAYPNLNASASSRIGSLILYSNRIT